MTGAPFNPSWDGLALDRETMRDLGYRTVDAVIDMLTEPAQALRRATPEEMRQRLPGELPEAGTDLPALLDMLGSDVLPFMGRLDHPGYFAFIPGCGTFPGALGDFIGAVINPDVGIWSGCAGLSHLELVVLDWFKQWIGYPSEAAGILVSGGSAANLTALACAREALLGPMTDNAVVYVGDQAHSSLARSARLMGFRPEQVRVLLNDDQQRMSPDRLAAAIDADIAGGRQPLCVGAAAGSTNTGAVDPLAELAAICHERGVWLHVDGAYGGFAALTERGRAALAGIGLADSVTLDPHKWLYQPIECGSLLVREGHLLRQAFEIAPDYLKEYLDENSEVNFADRGLQLTRGSRALKIWLSISYFGAAAFREGIDRCLDLALFAEEQVRADPRLELMSPASLGIIAFRRHCSNEDDATRVNAHLVSEFERSGQGLVSTTRLHGRYAVRLCVMNHTTGEEHVREVLDFFAEADLPSTPVVEPPPPSRDAGVADDSWLGGDAAAFSASDLEGVPLFADLGADALARIAATGTEHLVPTGGAVVRRWEPTRDLHVVLSGRAVAERNGRQVATFDAGDFFGEFAAMDWGAGFGYSRQATVTAASPLRVMSLSPEALGALISELPELEQRLRATVRERLREAQLD